MKKLIRQPLSELAAVFNGKTPAKSDQRESGHPVLKIRDVDENGRFRGRFDSFVDPKFAADFTLKHLKTGDTLILNAAHNADYVGSKQFFAKGDVEGALATGEWLIVRPDGIRLDATYAHYWLTSERARLQMKEMVKGIHLYPKDVARLEIPLPPLPEQRRIAAILDKANVLRRKRRHAIELLDSLTQSIFLEMFGDPVSNTRGWPSETLGTLGVQMTYGPRFYNEAYSEDGLRIVRITDLADNGTLNFAAMPRLAMPEGEVLAHRSRPGEILFARTGATVGKMALVTANDPPSIPGAYFIRMRFPDNVVPLFAWCALRTHSIQKIIFEGSRQSAQQNFSGPGLRRLPMIIPPKQAQLAFCDRVDRTGALRPANSEMSSKLNSLFTSLQSRAFSGEL
ncbi:restriction endonuclease subunit S [Mesorhizobium sp. M0046]|uniref:restriction endonuclease subunit S n=1 Tax=Mesorhizobium sp. M0046 TaxID=2956858 RepID=UPI00333DFF47